MAWIHVIENAYGCAFRCPDFKRKTFLVANQFRKLYINTWVLLSDDQVCTSELYGKCLAGWFAVSLHLESGNCEFFGMKLPKSPRWILGTFALTNKCIFKLNPYICLSIFLIICWKTYLSFAINILEQSFILSLLIEEMITGRSPYN